MNTLKRFFRFSRPRYVHIVDNKQLPLGEDYNLEAHLRRIIEFYRIDTVVDVGANEGQFGTKIRNSGFSGEIYSFEPVRQVFENLQKITASDKLWKAYNVAIGAQHGEVEVNVSQGTDFSSILDVNEFGASKFKRIKVTRKEKVELHRLDEYLSKLVDIKSRRILLKTDTQGYDTQVIEGSSAILKNVCALVSELSLIPIYHGMSNHLEMLSIYKNAGFSISGIYPVSRNKNDLSLIEVDCVMVKRDMF